MTYANFMSFFLQFHVVFINCMTSDMIKISIIHCQLSIFKISPLTS